MEVDDIISYHDVVTAERAVVAKGSELWRRQGIIQFSLARRSLNAGG
jgi:hypothetical protein